jgi:hypothetical protein
LWPGQASKKAVNARHSALNLLKSKIRFGGWMRRGNFLWAYILSAVTGLLLWTATAAMTGKREPWDASSYWTVSYPLAVTGAAVLGFLFPEKSWRWAAILMLMQLVVMVAMGSDLSLLPLGLVALAVLGAPLALAGVLAAKLRQLRAG